MHDPRHQRSSAFLRALRPSPDEDQRIQNIRNAQLLGRIRGVPAADEAEGAGEDADAQELKG